MKKWNPAEHLPECGVTRYPICICDRLRACEKRVGREMESVIEHYQTVAREEALDAARDAVVNADPHWKVETDDGDAVFVMEVGSALAAIDALRGES